MIRKPPVDSGGATGTAQSDAIDRAVSVGGLTERFRWFYDEFLAAAGPTSAPPWYQNSSAGTGTARVGTTSAVGRLLLDTGASGNLARVIRYGMLTASIKNARRWYMEFYGKVSTTVTSDTRAYVGFWNSTSTQTLELGVVGALSTANFVVQYDGVHAGSSLSTGVAIDTSDHLFKMWWNGSTLLAQIDSNASVSVTPSTDLSSPFLVMEGFNNNVAAVRSFEIEHVFVAANAS